jgi:hydroxymethylglutaryl-CoA lyase
MNWPAKVIVCEVGPRDGLQNEKKLLSVEQKVELIEKSVQAGAKIVEIGSFVHPKAVPQMADTDEVARRIHREPGVEYRALVMNQKGLERAAAAGIMKAKITASASPAHSISNLNRTPEEVVSSFAKYAEFAAANQIELSGAISTAFGCPFDGKPVPLQQVLSVAACFRKIGIKELSLSDTTGMANPKQVYDYVTAARLRLPDVTWVLHFHDTRGMGLSNVVAGLLAGVDRYDACFAGLGGCPFAPGASGNIATEDLVHMLEEMGISTGYDQEKLIELGKQVQTMVGHDTASSVLKAGRCCDIAVQNKKE